MLSQVLMHKQLRHPGMPRHMSLNVSSAGGGSSASVPHNLNSPEGYDTQSIVLALRTLGSFNFDGTCCEKFTYFISHCKLHNHLKICLKLSCCIRNSYLFDVLKYLSVPTLKLLLIYIYI